MTFARGTLPFDVPVHERMVLRIAGKFGDTVFTIEQQIFNWVIREYTDKYSWERQWCYDHEIHAFVNLSLYLIERDMEEPQGWKRAIVAGQPTRYGSQQEREADDGSRHQVS